MAMLRLCKPSRPTKAKATMVSATSTSMSVKPPWRPCVPSPGWLGRSGAARNAERATRSARARRAPSPGAAEVEVARRDIHTPGQRLRDVQGVFLHAVSEVDDRRIDVAVRVEV